MISKFNFNWFFCGDELGEMIQNFLKIFEIFQNGPLIKGLNKECIFSKIAWSPKSSIWAAFGAAKKPWRLLRQRNLGFRRFWKRCIPYSPPWLVDHFGMFQRFFENSWSFRQVCRQQTNQLKLNLEGHDSNLITESTNDLLINSSTSK